MTINPHTRPVFGRLPAFFAGAALLLAGAPLLTAQQMSWLMIDDFSNPDYQIGQPVDGTGGWVANDAYIIAEDPHNPANRVMSVTSDGNDLLAYNLFPEPIRHFSGNGEQGRYGTLTFNALIQTDPDSGGIDMSHNAGSSYRLEPSGTNWAAYHQLRGETPNNMHGFRDGGSSEVVAAVDENVWYTVWIVHDMQEHQYDAYIVDQSNGFRNATEDDLVAENFAFREQRVGDDLESLYMRIFAGSARIGQTAMYDNFAIDPDNMNLTVVPEPSTVALFMGLGIGLGVVVLRRRRR